MDRRLPDVWNELANAITSSNSGFRLKEVLGFYSPEVIHEMLQLKQVQTGLTLLHLASMQKPMVSDHNPLNALKLLLTHGATVDAIDCHGWTPLHHAALKKEPLFLEPLISKGANINKQTQRDWTPLHIACLHQNFMTAKKLLILGANPHIKDQTGKAPLHLYCKYGAAKEWINLFINSGANINTQDNEGNTPLHSLCMTGTDDPRWLLKNGANRDTLNNDGKTPLGTAIQCNTQSQATWLKAHGAREIGKKISEKDIVHRLIHACINGEEHLINRLLSEHSEQNTFLVNTEDHRERTCLDEAIQGEYPHIVQKLLDAGANPNRHNYTYGSSLALACQLHGTQGLEIVTCLLKHGALTDIRDESGQTPLHLAHSYELASLLLQHGALVNSQDKKGVTPLHLAAYNNKRDTICLLLEYGANINIKDANNLTPLEYATHHNFGHHHKDLCDQNCSCTSTILIKNSAKTDRMQNQ